MQKRKFDELISYVNRKVSEMNIGTSYKMELLGMVTALGYAYEKENEERKTGRWIPCSERLPEENSDILITYVEKDEKRIVPVNYGCGTWFDCLFDKVLNQAGVLAWMPTPEPYREGGEAE